MSCACENRKLSQELERARRLAKAWTRLEEKTAALYRNEDGTYHFAPAETEINKEIIEYITPY